MALKYNSYPRPGDGDRPQCKGHQYFICKKCKYVANNKAIIFATKNALTDMCKGIFLSVANKLQKFG
jgi:hypothetical protein